MINTEKNVIQILINSDNLWWKMTSTISYRVQFLKSSKPNFCWINRIRIRLIISKAAQNGSCSRWPDESIFSLPGFLQQHWGCSALPWLQSKTIASTRGVSLSWNIWEQRPRCGCAPVHTALFVINNEVAAYTCNPRVASFFCRCACRWQNKFEKISGLPADWACFPSYLQLWQYRRTSSFTLSFPSCLPLS